MEGPFMKARRYLLAALGIAALFLAASCASTGCGGLEQGADESVLVPMVAANPQAYEGARVLWAGVILSTTPHPEGTTVEILEKPRGGSCRPESGDATSGRFLAEYDRFLDPAVYCHGRELTVAGLITGTEVRTIGEYEYTYPVLAMTNHVLWPPRKKTDVSPYPRFYPYYPYYPYYDPFYRPLKAR
jgi:outer membrane lipoprotein